MTGKNPWDTKVSVVSGATSSYASTTDSELKFTRKFSQRYRWRCCIIETILVFLLIFSLSLYAGYDYLQRTYNGEEKVFRGDLRANEYGIDLIDFDNPDSQNYQHFVLNYTNLIKNIINSSPLEQKFVDAEVISLEPDDGVLKVNFGLRFEPVRWRMSVTVEDILSAFRRLYPSTNIVPGSLHIRQITNNALISTKPSTLAPEITSKTTEFYSTKLPPRRCTPVRLNLCKSVLEYNLTSYPNHFGHSNLDEIHEDLITFRDLVDAECYQRTLELVCQLLQPACIVGPDGDEAAVVLPCEHSCRLFTAGCGHRIPPKLRDGFDCSKLPDYSNIGGTMCASRPGCDYKLRTSGLSNRLCDGVLDCQDISDETTCGYCPAGYLHCITSRTCVPVTSRCDGVADCPGETDERNCLLISPTARSIDQTLPLATIDAYPPDGYVFFVERGMSGKLCAANFQTDIPNPKMNAALQTIAMSLCRTLNYQNLTNAEVVDDEDQATQVPPRYVHVVDPFASEITFNLGTCPSKKVLHVACNDPVCGVQTSRRQKHGVDGLNKMASHGDWPWHAILYKSGTHVCDGTLISPEWLLTSASCFQGQSKAEWVARLGAVRLNAMSPWQQERHIVGMVKSPVEGSTLVLIKLSSPVTYSDHIRSVCLSDEHTEGPYLHCQTLGWAKNRDSLQRIEVKESSMESCANISITTVNSLCFNSIYDHNDCTEEEFAGSPMMCLSTNKRNWVLVGVTNWRIACSADGMMRPRLYDKVKSNHKWINTVLKDG
ncbi:Low-density lipoprotein (LDL) receptor class A, conserved site,SEA domain,Low-density lipoprotein (LDL) [Cinara cedri]|uniref:Low-density lipoprotein (LDL) receptor class A, conserved site,SEA domain,Low-density lipoprotein (LDL) n=1 Tax=Cinara cedri TaxID=506608 RepID=A0A5E4M1K1_9HEMI|nr:Low-density lipoprotein (LDL) receptor class A, conserved site,SEA domain,Low-density lipoprotein (LDL) [Cinara cedri]